MKAMTPGTHQPCPFFLVRSSGDEATAVLAFAQFIAWFASQAWLFQVNAFEVGIARIRMRASLLASVVGLLLILASAVALSLSGVLIIVALIATTAPFGWQIVSLSHGGGSLSAGSNDD